MFCFVLTCQYIHDSWFIHSLDYRDGQNQRVWSWRRNTFGFLCFNDLWWVRERGFPREGERGLMWMEIREGGEGGQLGSFSQCFGSSPHTHSLFHHCSEFTLQNLAPPPLTLRRRTCSRRHAALSFLQTKYIFPSEHINQNRPDF